MGWTVLGLGNIDVDEKYMKEILDLMIGDKKEVIDKLTNNEGCDFSNVEGNGGGISFEMWGNKGIDYSKLDFIRNYCKKHKIDVEISVNEYIESSDGGGYYHNSGDEE